MMRILHLVNVKIERDNEPVINESRNDNLVTTRSGRISRKPVRYGDTVK